MRKLKRGIGLAIIVHLLAGVPLTGDQAAGNDDGKPNFIIIFADDLGYGDLGCFGHPTIRTPHLDRLASEGMKLTSFYVASSVCTPSRAALLTGRLPIRSGMSGDAKRRVLYPHHEGGLVAGEVTIAEVLKEAGYATGCVGKWHLGVGEEHVPNSQGFDYYYGLLYSNDMNIEEGRVRYEASMNPDADPGWYDIPLYRNRSIIERPVEQHTLTKRYAEEAVQFIDRHKDEPFLLYLPHTMPHVPLFASKDFEGKSPRGRYGDTVEEIDLGVGEIVRALREAGIDKKTLILFTSDNGPWLRMQVNGGSGGLLRDGKGGCWEGGFRVPAIAWWPGKIPAGSVHHGMVSTMDLLPTLAGLTGAAVPPDRIIDGIDMRDGFLRNKASPRDTYFYYRGNELYAVRKGIYKAHFSTWDGYSRVPAEEHDPPLLFNLEMDPSEKHDIAQGNPVIVEELSKLAADHIERMEPGEPQFYTLLPVWGNRGGE
ncbi:MAG: sulfatase [Puniceicoccaceae bacterium]